MSAFFGGTNYVPNTVAAGDYIQDFVSPLESGKMVERQVTNYLNNYLHHLDYNVEAAKNPEAVIENHKNVVYNILGNPTGPTASFLYDDQGGLANAVNQLKYLSPLEKAQLRGNMAMGFAKNFISLSQGHDPAFAKIMGHVNSEVGSSAPHVGMKKSRSKSSRSRGKKGRSKRTSMSK